MDSRNFLVWGYELFKAVAAQDVPDFTIPQMQNILMQANMRVYTHDEESRGPHSFLQLELPTGDGVPDSLIVKTYDDSIPIKVVAVKKLPCSVVIRDIFTAARDGEHIAAYTLDVLSAWIDASIDAAKPKLPVPGGHTPR